MKEFLKNKKVIIAIIAIVSIIGVGVGIGMFMGNDAVQLNDEKLTGLIETPYTIDAVSEDDSSATFNISGDLTKENVVDLAKELYKVGSHWGKTQATYNIFSNGADANFSGFYTEGLRNKIEIDFEKGKAKVGSFEIIPATDKSKTLVNYNQGTIVNNDGNIVIEMDMAVDENPTNVVSQAKAFSVLFRDSNKNKDIKSVELRLNPNSVKNVYAFNTDYENLLETIEIITF